MSSNRMFSKILIANRGEIACRVMRTAQAMGICCVAVYSDADRQAQHVKLADEAYHLGGAAVADSYLRADNILAIAQACGAEAIHPGYGFLSENPGFVTACEQAGVVFIGPPASSIEAMGLKDAAKKLMQQAGVAVVPGYHGDEQDAAYLAQQAEDIGYPVLIKARAGGGGKGMRKVEQASDFAAALQSAQREGEAAFGDGHVLIEKYITQPRHIEVQVFADQQGNTVYLFERDCSLQRRHQKVIEEAPAPGMTAEMRQAMGEAAVNAAKAVGYVGAGTVEFIVDGSAGLQPDKFWFMEMNTRLQVEHPVTEAITGLDLVALQLQVAAGQPLPFTQDQLAINGHAFEARLYAEDAAKGFLPSIGTLHHLHLPADKARIDGGVVQGDTITPHYDPMIAKLIVWGESREVALNKLLMALQASRVSGCTTNIDFLARLAAHQGFRRGEVDTGLIERDMARLMQSQPPALAVLALAALAVLAGRQRSAAADPWNGLSGWGQWAGGNPVYLDLNWQDTEFALRLERSAADGWTVSAADEHINITVLEQSAQAVTIQLEQAILSATVVQHGQQLTVFHAGEQYVLQQPDYLQMTAEEGQAANQLSAPMPGQVKIINAASGDSVTKGQVLLVMEAMKMEMALHAPRDGVVAAVNVLAGDQVTEGTVLLMLAEEA